MAAATYHEKTDEQKAITEMVRQFADEQILPNAEHYDHEDEFPEPIVEQMKELGLFGVTIPEEYGGMGLDLTTYAMIVEELSRGWISISGIVNTHFIGSYLLMKFGTDEQKQKYLPRMATGEIRAAFSLSEPELGSDVQAIKTQRQEGRRRHLRDQRPEDVGHQRPAAPTLVFVLVKTDPEADPRHKGLTCFIAEKEPGARENTGDYAGLNVPPKIKKMGYKGVESTELVFDGYRCPAENILGGEEAGLNKGFAQMMDALEVGRVNVAARGVGIAQRALELALRYSQERKTFGKPIAEHQAIQFKLADMATKVEAARLLTLRAARLKDAGERSDLEAGMAKLFASEAGRFCVEESFRIHGGYGYSKEYEIERLYRDAPLLLIGEGTSEIQRMVIGTQAPAAPQDLAIGTGPAQLHPDLGMKCASEGRQGRTLGARGRRGTCRTVAGRPCRHLRRVLVQVRPELLRQQRVGRGQQRRRGGSDVQRSGHDVHGRGRSSDRDPTSRELRAGRVFGTAVHCAAGHSDHRFHGQPAPSVRGHRFGQSSRRRLPQKQHLHDGDIRILGVLAHRRVRPERRGLRQRSGSSLLGRGASRQDRDAVEVRFAKPPDAPAHCDLDVVAGGLLGNCS